MHFEVPVKFFEQKITQKGKIFADKVTVRFYQSKKTLKMQSYFRR
jgi:hypothetical protein